MKVGNQWFPDQNALTCSLNQQHPNIGINMTDPDRERTQEEIKQDKLSLKVSSVKKTAWLMLFILCLFIIIFTAIFWEFFLESLPEFLIAGPLFSIITAVLSLIGYRLMRRKQKTLCNRIKRKEHLLNKHDETDVLFENLCKK
jgi:uncharacterized protein YacL